MKIKLIKKLLNKLKCLKFINNSDEMGFTTDEEIFKTGRYNRHKKYLYQEKYFSYLYFILHYLENFAFWTCVAREANTFICNCLPFNSSSCGIPIELAMS